MNINTGGGLIGLLILIGDIWAIINILQSNAGMGAKLLWILLVVLLPLLHAYFHRRQEQEVSRQ